MLCLFVSFPDLFIGAHAKKQGEDLSDNDGDEDEGILYGDEGGSMSLNLFFVVLFLCLFLFLSENYLNQTFGRYLCFLHSHHPKRR